MKPYLLTIAECIALLETNAESGLSKEQVKKRQSEYGPNELIQHKPESWALVFLRQFANPLVYILIAAALLIFFISDDHRDAFIIAGILIFNAIIGTVQEGRTRRILATLHHFIPLDCVVIRDGKKGIVNKIELVPGDIIVVQEGQRIPVDARLIQAQSLYVDEAVLTGESVPVRKNSDALTGAPSLAEQSNMIFQGTFIHKGYGLAVVTSTGTHTHMGKLQRIALDITIDVPLRKELDRLASVILMLILGLCALLFIMGLIAGLSLHELFVTLTALFICVVPEGLPVVLTLVLVAGIYRMARQRVLVKNMQAVEGLGRTQVIVIDKTGTLTRNEMIVSQVYADGKRVAISGKGYFEEGSLFVDGASLAKVDEKSDLYHLALAAQLLNRADITYLTKRGTFDIKGDPTEAALYVFSRKIITDEHSYENYRLLYEVPFDSVVGFHAAFYQKNDGIRVFVIGSPESLLERAKKIPAGMKEAIDALLLQGLRVVVVAMKEWDTKDAMTFTDDQKDYRLLIDKVHILGVCGIEDSVRPEVAHVIRQARLTGLRIIMATGDHLKTALRVAQTVGIYREGDEIMEGKELSALSSEALKEKLKDTTVFARVSAQDKVTIITALREQGYIVAMTGDGINDVPALAAADLGIAMGASGTEVAKEAADLILLDDSFVNIVHAIEQGRHIFYTLRRVILYFFVTNMAEVLIIFFAFVINAFRPGNILPLPLLAAHILWLNLVTDGFLDVALSAEPLEKGLLNKQGWLENRVRLVDAALLLKTFFVAIPMALVSLGVFLLVYPYDLPLARTMTLVTLGCFQWFNAWNCRAESRSLFRLGWFTNPWLIAATGVVVILQLLLLYVPFLQGLFHIVPLTGFQWLFIIVVTSSIIVVEEVRKWFVRRWWPGF